LTEIGDGLVDWEPQVMESIRGGEITNLTLNQVVKRISRSGVKLVLLLDEFEQITNNSNIDRSFFSNLRALPTQYNLTFTISSQTPLHDLPYFDGSSLTPNFFNLFRPLDLGLFNPEEAKNLMIELSQRAGAPFSERTMKFILDAAGLHPFFLQVACRCVFERRRIKAQLDEADYQSLYQEICGELKGDFSYYWDTLKPAQQAVLASLKTAQTDPDNEPYMEALAKQSLIVKKETVYSYVAATFKDFVRERPKVAQLPGSRDMERISWQLGSVHILEGIGAGNMATVYKAYQPSLDRHVAVKVLSNWLGREGFLERFQQEARSVARLRHPNILTVHDFGQEGDLAYIVMDYVSGGTLKDLIGEKVTLETALEIIIQIGSALHYAHQEGIIHRDVKPGNILMDQRDRPLLTDFGLAKVLKASVQLTESGIGMGTAAYVAPEQASGKAVDARSDVYALGIVLYEMVTGRLPFEAENGITVLLKKLQEPPPPPRQFNPSLPIELEQVILKAIAPLPEDRYQSALEMIEALRSAIN
jgi:hypothetical protein